jgi:threonine/homoserine/homoserine lactone efflux protein
MLTFAITCILLIITPGPGVLSVAGVGSGFGFEAGSRYLWGLCAGNIMVAITVVSGLAAAVLAVPVIREVLLFVSVCYMIYLAAKVAFAGSKIGFIEARESPGFKDGIALQAINPKAYVANTVLFTGFSFLPNNIPAEITLKFLIWIGLWIPVHFGWLMIGVAIRRMSLTQGTQRIVNYGMALSMLIVVALALTSHLRFT